MNNVINLESNDSFYNLRGNDLKELLLYIESYFLEYRDTLNIPQNITFGVEIEYERTFKFLADRYIKKHLPNWKSKSDGSLDSGGEIISPIMVDSKNYWDELKIICRYLTKKKADTLHNAGGHIHIGSNVLGRDIEAWKTFLKLYTAYEHVIFRFGYGDKINGRNKLLEYAMPSADILKDSLDEIDQAKDIVDVYAEVPLTSKYVALNFQNVKFKNMNDHIGNTIEFRCPNATTNEIIWQNNINAFTKMLLSSKQGVIDIDFLDYKLDKEYIPFYNNRYTYNNINLKNVLEFVDLIFDNNLDKIYFLRQYLKDYKETNISSTIIKSKKFVK